MCTSAALQMNDDEDVNDYRNPMSQESIRHGDLRPENILRFLDGKSRIGTLKLGDMDLAKRHIAATDQRRSTSIRYGSRRYGGPETMGAIEGRSRLYDIWSMGCITFEFIVWLLYGNEALVEFFNQADILSSPSEFQYYKLQGTGAGLRHIVNPLVTSWMDHMQKHDPEFRQSSKSALKDLLQIVQDQLLVVDLPPTRRSALAAGGGARGLSPYFVGGKMKYRATAAEFRDALDTIKEKEGEPNYVCTGQDRSDVSLPAPPRTYKGFLDPLAQHHAGSSRGSETKTGPFSTGVSKRTIRADHFLPPLDSWKFEVDNSFATKAIKHLNVEGLPGPTTIPNKLCGRCAKLNFWLSGFVIDDDVDDLAKSATTCDFCALLQVASSGTDRPRSEKIRFERTQSVIAMVGNPFPVLSIVRSPGK
jgi:serine/threonine protein kinase